MSISFGGFNLKAFGAYIRTDLSSLQSIAGQSSNIIGIMGMAEKGPVNKAVTITSSSELIRTFGGGPLVVHGLAAYVGGASTLVAVRLGGATKASLTALEASPGSTESYVWLANELGGLGNNILVSVEVADNGPGLEDDQYIIRVKYTDSQGNDIREVFVIPRFVPDMTGKYYTGNTGDYYVLRDRDTGAISEVPRTWGYNNSDLDAFLTKVEDMKSTSQDLLGPFPFEYFDSSTATTKKSPFPLALVASVVNFGGMGHAPSGLLTLTGADPGLEELLSPGFIYDPENAEYLLPHPFVKMSGGKNGDDGTNYFGIYDDFAGTTDWEMTYDIPAHDGVMDVWDEALEVLEDEDVNFVQPAYLFNGKAADEKWKDRYGYFKALMPKIVSHVNLMSNIPNRMFRTSVVGVPYYKFGSDTANKTTNDFLDDIQDISGIINNDRMQLWVGGFSSNAFSNRVMNYGGEMLASFAVGAHASRDVATSLTFAQMSGIFTHGLEFAFNTSQRDELYTRRHAFVMRRRTASGALEHVAAHNYTSFTGAPNRGLPLMVTRRIVDYVADTTYKNTEETYIGRASRGADTELEIRDYITAILNSLVTQRVLVAFADVEVKADSMDKTVYHVSYRVQPVTEIDFITITQHLTYQLA